MCHCGPFLKSSWNITFPVTTTTGSICNWRIVGGKLEQNISSWHMLWVRVPLSVKFLANPRIQPEIQLIRIGKWGLLELFTFHWKLWKWCVCKTIYNAIFTVHTSCKCSGGMGYRGVYSKKVIFMTEWDIFCHWWLVWSFTFPGCCCCDLKANSGSEPSAKTKELKMAEPKDILKGKLSKLPPTLPSHFHIPGKPQWV